MRKAPTSQGEAIFAEELWRGVRGDALFTREHAARKAIGVRRHRASGKSRERARWVCRAIEVDGGAAVYRGRDIEEAAATVGREAVRCVREHDEESSVAASRCGQRVFASRQRKVEQRGDRLLFNEAADIGNRNHIIA